MTMPRRPVRLSFALSRALLLFCALALVAAAAVRPGSAPAERPSLHGIAIADPGHAGRPATAAADPIKMTLPLEVALRADESLLRPGSPATVTATLTTREPIDQVRLRVATEGPVAVDGPAASMVGGLVSGSPLETALTARVSDVGQAAVTVWADALAADGTPLYSRRATLYALVRSDRTLAGETSFHDLALRGIQEDQDAGLLAAADADAARLALVETPAARDSEPVQPRAFTPQEQELNSLIGVPTAGRLTGSEGAVPSPSDGTITVQGNVQWTDENGTTHPVFGASVNILDDDGILGTEFITAVPTDTAGNYFAVINNDDGLGQGNRDVFVRVLAGNTLVVTKDNSSNIYSMTSGVHNETPSGTTITENFTAANSGGGEAWSVFQAGTWVAVYAEEKHGSALASCDIVWPFAGGTFYNGHINALQLDRWDWDVIMHEYGHHIQAQLNTANNPGGSHGGGCASDARSSKDQGVRLAWGEGWPTYDGTVAQQILNLASLGVPRVGDAIYQDLEDQTLVYGLDTDDSSGIGEDNETAVQRLLWDLFDGVNDNRDTISRSDQDIWDVIDAADPPTLSSAWSALRAGQTNQVDLLMGMIASDQTIGPRLIAPAANAIVTPSSASFTWNKDVGCSSSYKGNSFALAFYDSATFAKVLTVSGLSSPSATLSPSQVATLIASSHHMLWAVEGSNTDSPSTGPFLGENFPVTVNTPPVADAGPDQPNVECSSHTTTPATLNGTGSSDADGDSLTYTWSAAGVSFNDIHSATPVGQFHEGTTQVTLTVSDGIQQDDGTVNITVVDTTAPAIACPSDATVECTGNNGIQASDPQLAAFFAGASATDICDPNPTISNNAPSFFPLGTTPVTFTAKDADGNHSSCVANVKVQDTTPPTIAMSLDRTVLRPPNHRLVDINASVTVTDVCDPHPTFVLTSIVSNEPDNGLGDGDTAGDIQGAALGTADTQFQLRAERAGNLSGRVYTIVYTGSDHSGNTATAAGTVKVPHNASGTDSLRRRGGAGGGWTATPVAP